MKVCIDIQAAIAQRAGVGRYTKALAEHLGPLADQDDLCLFYFDFRKNGAPFAVPGARQRAIRWVPGRAVQGAWRSLGLPPFDWFAGPADLYHFPNFIRPPLARGRSVVTIHDAAFLRFPETIEQRNYRYLSARIRKTIDRADALITVSRFTARELEELLGAPADRLRPIPEGLSSNMRPSEPAAVETMRRALGIDGPYLLTVGTLEPRKNIAFLVDLFERLETFDGSLVVAGMPGWKYEPLLARMEQSPRAGRIRYLRYVEEAHLPALYSGAELFLFPSLYEGFGFPPLEAMACGTPVLAAATGSLPEVLGEAAVLVDHYDAEGWAAHVDGLLRDGAQRDALRARGRNQAARYTWAETARRTWALYRELGP